MTYRFETHSRNFADYASGRVFYNAPGQPAFPVRLGSEMLQRCLAIRQQNGLMNRATLYDPCCGGGYLLSTLAYLHRASIGTIIASDVDETVLAVAARNLSLLTAAGLSKRTAELVDLYARFEKLSHALALESVAYFEQLLQAQAGALPVQIFQADVTKFEQLQAGLAGQAVDILLADVPYGQRTAWQGDGGADPLAQMLDAVAGVLQPDSLVAIAVDKGQKCRHSTYRQLQRFQIGKRRIYILQLA